MPAEAPVQLESFEQAVRSCSEARHLFRSDRDDLKIGLGREGRRAFGMINLFLYRVGYLRPVVIVRSRMSRLAAPNSNPANGKISTLPAGAGARPCEPMSRRSHLLSATMQFLVSAIFAPFTVDFAASIAGCRWLDSHVLTRLGMLVLTK